jgi:hypothetical protein
MKDDQVLTITCDSEEVASSLNSELLATGSAGQILKRDNLTGDAATWMVVVGTAITTLPKILDSLAKIIATLKIRSIRVGEKEIRNPTADDIRAMRKTMAD